MNFHFHFRFVLLDESGDEVYEEEIDAISDEEALQMALASFEAARDGAWVRAELRRLDETVIWSR